MTSRQPNFHSSSSNTSPRAAQRDQDTVAPQSAYAVPARNGGASTSDFARHAHTQSTFDAAIAKVRTHERHASFDVSGVSSGGVAATSIPPLGSQKKNRSNIISGTGTNSGALAPLNHSPSARTIPEPVMTRPAAHSVGDAPSGSDLPTSPGSLSERDRPTNLASERVKGMHASSSVRSLSPIRARPSMSITTSNVGGKSHSAMPLTPAATPTLASFAHLSVHGPSLALVPSAAPCSVTTVPLSSGIIISLHVSGQCFLTSPETLLKVIHMEGGGSSQAKSPVGDMNLLQWIGEDALLKHREASADAGRGSNSSYLQKPSGRHGSKSVTAAAGDSSCEPSPRSANGLGSNSSYSSPTLAPIGATTVVTSPPPGLPSTVHSSDVGSGSPSSSALAYHAPTYSYFLDRNPAAFSLILDYLRDGAGNMRRALTVVDLSSLHALQVESDHFGLAVLGALVSTELRTREQARFLGEDDRFWCDVVTTIDALFPIDPMRASGLALNGVTYPSSPGSTTTTLAGNAAANAAAAAAAATAAAAAAQAVLPLSPRQAGRAHLQSNIGNMLRRLAFQRDPMLRVCHATYRHTESYEERLLEILHTNCQLCQRKIFYRPIGLREGRDTGCPVHPREGQWDRKARMWTCCGSPEFSNSGCQFTGIHYTVWTFWNSTD